MTETINPLRDVPYGANMVRFAIYTGDRLAAVRNLLLHAASSTGIAHADFVGGCKHGCQTFGWSEHMSYDPSQGFCSCLDRRPTDRAAVRSPRCTACTELLSTLINIPPRQTLNSLLLGFLRIANPTQDFCPKKRAEPHRQQAS